MQLFRCARSGMRHHDVASGARMWSSRLQPSWAIHGKRLVSGNIRPPRRLSTIPPTSNTLSSEEVARIIASRQRRVSSSPQQNDTHSGTIWTRWPTFTLGFVTGIGITLWVTLYLVPRSASNALPPDLPSQAVPDTTETAAAEESTVQEAKQDENSEVPQSTDAVEAYVLNSAVIQRLERENLLWVDFRKGEFSHGPGNFFAKSYNTNEPNAEIPNFKDPQTHMVVGFHRPNQQDIDAAVSTFPNLICGIEADLDAVTMCKSLWYPIGSLCLDTSLRGDPLPFEIESDLVVITAYPALLMPTALEAKMQSLFHATHARGGDDKMTYDQLCNTFYVRYRYWDDEMQKLVDFHDNVALVSCDVPPGWPGNELGKLDRVRDALEDLTSTG